MDNSVTSIHGQINTAQTLIDNGLCVVCMEFGGLSDGADYLMDFYWTGKVPSFSGTWLNNYMAVCDSTGLSGYMAWEWGYGSQSAQYLCSDWSGNSSGYGNVIRSYYLTH